MLSRLKFDISDLVEEVLDQFPEHVWVSDKTTFFDPAMGGGQFVRGVIDRLYSYGHLRDNIESRVFGCEDHERSVKYAVNKNKLIGTFWSDNNILEHGFDMSFDVVLGNPPYQSTSDGSKRKKAWILFSSKAMDIVADSGYIAFVTPNAWKKQSKYFKNLQQELVHNLIAMGDANAYFSIGEDTGWWIFSKRKDISKVSVTIGNPQVDKIYEKVKKHPTEIPWHYRDFSSFKKCKYYTLLDVPTNKHTRPVYWTAKQTLYADPNDVRYDGWKVIINNSGHFPSGSDDKKYAMISNEYAVGLGAWGIPVNSKKEGKRVLSWATSKLYRFIVTQRKTGGFNNPFIELQHLGVDYNWTDKELYEHFSLTNEEIKLIEETIK